MVKKLWIIFLNALYTKTGKPVEFEDFVKAEIQGGTEQILLVDDENEIIAMDK
ncbi:hypothetical protein [Desulfobacula sp.]|uniref:hypothetical protein n=1 Tax=Desulfobacula sp. TaxID=2593537 RepID=UPI00261AF6AA|nr:hypothetical protein [Desulfobacula sp.]